MSLPREVIKLLEEYSDLIKELDTYFTYKISDKSEKNAHSMNAQTRTGLIKLRDLLTEAFKSASNEENNWESIVEQIWCFGPRRNGPNVLVNKIKGYDRPSLWSCLNDKSDNGNGKRTLRQYDYCIVSGFQMATLSGPLCGESMHGVCLILEAWETYDKALSVKERKSLQRDLDSLKQDSVKRVDSGGSLKDHGKISSDSNNGTVDTQNLLADGKSAEIITSQNSKGNVHTVETCSNFNIDKAFAEMQSGDELLHDKSRDVMDGKSKPSADMDSIAASPNSPGSPGWCAAPREVYGPFSGQLMSCMKEGCKRAFQAQPQRLMWAMYTCVVQATTEVLGR